MASLTGVHEVHVLGRVNRRRGAGPTWCTRGWDVGDRHRARARRSGQEKRGRQILTRRAPPDDAWCRLLPPDVLESPRGLTCPPGVLANQRSPRGALREGTVGWRRVDQNTLPLVLDLGSAMVRHEVRKEKARRQRKHDSYRPRPSPPVNFDLRKSYS